MSRSRFVFTLSATDDSDSAGSDDQAAREDGAASASDDSDGAAAPVTGAAGRRAAEKERLQKKRLEARGGAAPRPHTQRRLPNAALLATATSDAALVTKTRFFDQHKCPFPCCSNARYSMDELHDFSTRR